MTDAGVPGGRVSRPFFRLTAKEIEAVAVRAWDSAGDLGKVADELRRRSTRAANVLRRKVDARLKDLGAAPPAMPNLESVGMSPTGTDQPTWHSFEEAARHVEAKFRDSHDLRSLVGAPLSVHVIPRSDCSPNDPYVTAEGAVPDLTLVVNTRHPHWTQKGSQNSNLRAGIWHCVADAIAEVVARRVSGPVRSHTALAIKDKILRAAVVPD